MKEIVQEIYKIYNLANKISNNPIVEGVAIQKEIYDETNRRINVKIIINETHKYIKEVTGKDYFKNSSSLSSKFTYLNDLKRGYEGAIESPDIVPGPFILNASVDMEKAREVRREMDELSNSLSGVRKLEQETFDNYLKERREELNAQIKNANQTFNLLLVSIDKTSNHEVEQGDYGYVKYESDIIFNRTNRIKLITKEQKERNKILIWKGRIW